MRLLFCALLPIALFAQSKTLEDNARIKIISALDKPHAPTALHKHDFNRVMIYLDSADQDIQHPGEATEHQHWKAGDVAWSPAGGMHISENMSNNNLRIVEIEIKQPAPAAPKRKKGLDPLEIDSCAQQTHLRESASARLPLDARFGRSREVARARRKRPCRGATFRCVGSDRECKRHAGRDEWGGRRRLLDARLHQAPRRQYRHSPLEVIIVEVK